VQARPRALGRLLFYADREQRRAYRWCVRNATKVWLDETHEFLFRRSDERPQATLREFWGAPVEAESSSRA